MAIKKEMKTLFDEKGSAWAVTLLAVRDGQIGEAFREGDLISVVGISKGKGFAGGMKRHGFAGGPRTHGQSDRPRSPGSIGSTTTPGRVFKGKKMAGRMGGDQVTVKNLEVFKIDSENNLLYVRGAVPGAYKSLVSVKKQ